MTSSDIDLQEAANRTFLVSPMRKRLLTLTDMARHQISSGKTKSHRPDSNRRPAVYKVDQPAVLLSYSLRKTRFFLRRQSRLEVFS